MRIGTWARAGDLVGVVAAADADEVTLFNPGDRQMARLPAAEVTPLPAGRVRVEVAVELPIPHGLPEVSLRRWVAALLDPVVRDRARAAVGEAGLDDAPLAPEPRLVVTRPEGSGAVCWRGHKLPAPDGATVECPSCGGPAFARPTSRGETAEPT